MTPDRWETVERLFHGALECDPDRRAAFLEAQSAGDAALKHEVERLLSHALAPSGFLERPALHEAAEQLSADERALPVEPQVAGYEVLGTLGEGGMGVVYLAEQAGPIRRTVALKLIKRGMDTRQVIARFEAERQALALMRHPHIASVYDAGTTPAGQPYFAMEYVKGLPITDYADRHRLTIRARLGLFLDVCGAVEHAHQKGIIHRDLKPSNVLVTDEDHRPVVKVIDFGVAKAIAPPLASGTAFTEQGAVIGTPDYMSPEQAAYSRDIDTKTDVYSLGVMLYELLAGVRPFERARPGPEGCDDLRQLLRDSDPPRPDARLAALADERRADTAAARQSDPDRLRRSLRGDLAWIVLRALERDRRRRYPAVGALAADIRRHLSDDPIEARPPSAAYRLRKFSRRHRGGVAAAATIVILVLAGLIATTTLYVQAQRALADAEYRGYLHAISAADSELREHTAAAARQRLLSVPEPHRGWEWHHLFLRSEGSLTTFTEPAACSPRPAPAIDRLAASADGTRLLHAYCRQLTSWDVATGEPAIVATRPGSKVVAVAADRLVLASPIGDGWQVSVMDVDLRVRDVGLVEREPLCADVGPGGHAVAIGHGRSNPNRGNRGGDEFEIWRVESGRRILLVPGEPPFPDTRAGAELACAVRFSPDGTRLATSGALVHIWNATTGAQIRRDGLQAGRSAQPIAFSPDGTRLAIGRRDGLIEVLPMTTGAAVVPFEASPPLLPVARADVSRRRGMSPYETRAVAFSPDGRRLVSAFANYVGIWDLSRQRLLRLLDGHAATVTGVSVPGNDVIYSADADGTVRGWSSTGTAGVTRFETGILSTLAVSRNGQTIVAGDVDGGITVWRGDDYRPLRLNPDEIAIAPGVTRPPPRSGLDRPVMRIALPAADGRSMLTVQSIQNLAGSISRWVLDPVAGMEPVPFNVEEPGCGQRRVIEFAALSTDERHLSYVHGECLVVRDLASNQTVARLDADGVGPPESARKFEHAFRPDGSLVVTTRPRRTGQGLPLVTVLLWDWRTDTRRVLHTGVYPPPSVLAVMPGLTGEISRIPVPNQSEFALSHDGSRLATGTFRDPVVRVWDARTGQLLLKLTDVDAYAGGIAFTPDGRLVTGRQGGGVTIWETRRLPGSRAFAR